MIVLGVNIKLLNIMKGEKTKSAKSVGKVVALGGDAIFSSFTILFNTIICILAPPL